MFLLFRPTGEKTADVGWEDSGREVLRREKLINRKALMGLSSNPKFCKDNQFILSLKVIQTRKDMVFKRQKTFPVQGSKTTRKSQIGSMVKTQCVLRQRVERTVHPTILGANLLDHLSSFQDK